MSDVWKNDFNAFYNDMGTRPQGMFLERIDNDGPYCLENCKWTDRTAQNNNKRNNKWLEYDGMCKTYSQWKEYYGIDADIGALLAAGYTPGQALGQEPRERRERANNYKRPSDEAFRQLTYSSRTQSIVLWSSETGVPAHAIRRRLDQLNWTPGQALGFEPSPFTLSLEMLTYDNVTMTIPEWAEYVGIGVSLLRWRLKNWTVEEALGIVEHVSQKAAPPKKTGPAETWTYNGITKKVTEWAKETGLTPAGLRRRKKNGLTMGQVLGYEKIGSGSIATR
jgi:hypothetical protein